MTQMAEVLTLGIFILTHTGGTIWFLSRVNTTMGFMLKKMDSIELSLAKTSSETMLKESATERFIKCEGQLAAIWRRLEESRDNYLLKDDFENYRKETRESLHDIKEKVIKIEVTK